MIQPTFTTFLMVVMFVILKHFTNETGLIILAWIFSLACILILLRHATYLAEIEIIQKEM